MKLLKKAGSVAMASTLLLSIAPAAFAEPSDPAVVTSVETKTDNASVEAKVTKDEAVAIAKKYLKFSSEYKLQSANLNAEWTSNGTGRSYWYLYFDKRAGDRSVGSINANIDANTGRLSNFGFYENDPDKKPSFPPAVDFAGAKKIANDWLSQMDGANFSQLRYVDRYEDEVKPPLDGNVQYHFLYERLVNGVPFPQDTVNINVNGDGKIVNYYSNWSADVTFESKDGVISQQDAEKTYREKSKLGLLYQLPYQGRDRKPYTAYTMETYSLNAKTGEWWSQSGAPMTQNTGDKPLSDKPLGQKPAANLNLTKEEAVKRVEQTFKLPTGYKIQNASYNEYLNTDSNEMISSWNLTWNADGMKDGEKIMPMPGPSIWANVNAKTGEVMNYNFYVQNYDPKTGQPLPVDAKVSFDDAKAKAIEFVKKMLPYYANELVYVPSPEPVSIMQSKTQRNFDFNFKHIVDGVSISYNSANVSVDRETGEINNYYANFGMTKYPAQKPDVIPVDKAKELLLSQYEVQLVYMLPYNFSGIPYEKAMLMKASGDMMPVNGQQQPSEAKLVYQLVSKYQREPFYLDAITGTWKSMSTGDPISLVKEQVTDIDGHWAKDALQLMLDYQALEVKDGKVNPDQSISKGEMIKMLVIAMNGGYYYGAFDMGARAASFADVSKDSKYFPYVETALDRRLIDKTETFNPEAKMTRDEMAQLVIRALGYNKLSMYDGMFNKSFSDVSAVKHVGAAAMAVGLGIMSVEDGKFNPNKEVTRAEAASSFYRYLQKRSALQENPYYY